MRRTPRLPSRCVWQFTFGSPFTLGTFGGVAAGVAVMYLTALLVAA